MPRYCRPEFLCNASRSIRRRPLSNAHGAIRSDARLRGLDPGDRSHTTRTANPRGTGPMPSSIQTLFSDTPRPDSHRRLPGPATQRTREDRWADAGDVYPARSIRATGRGRSYLLPNTLSSYRTRMVGLASDRLRGGGRSDYHFPEAHNSNSCEMATGDTTVFPLAVCRLDS